MRLPAELSCMEAHQQLEELILDRDAYRAKKDMGNLVFTGRLRRKMVLTAS